MAFSGEQMFNMHLGAAVEKALKLRRITFMV